MDIQDIIQKGTPVMLVVSAQDLERFAKSILAKAEENHRANTQDVKGEEQKKMKKDTFPQRKFRNSSESVVPPSGHGTRMDYCAITSSARRTSML